MNNQKIPHTPRATSVELSTSKKLGLNDNNSKNPSITKSSCSSLTKVNTEQIAWSPSLQSLLDQPAATLPRQMIWGGIAFFLIFGAWAWLGTIDEIGTAKGKLVPKGKTYKVESVELGKVSHIAVKEGQEVKAGQLLAKLNHTRETKEVERLKQILADYHIEINQKQSLLEKVKSEAQTHSQIAAAETSAQRLAIASAQDQAEVFRQLLAQQKAEMAAYDARKNHLAALSEITKNRFEHIDAEMKAHQERINRLKPLAKEGAVSREFIFQAEQARRQTQQQQTESQLQEITNTQEQIFQSQQSLRELTAQITQSQGELSSAIKEVEKLTADLKRQQAERSRLRLEAEAKIQQFELDIAQLQGKIAETKNLLNSAEIELKQKLLKSPVDGFILSFNVNNVGKVLQPGQTIAEVAPKNSPLVLSALLPNQEAGFVKTQMPVEVKLDAYSHQDYGAIPGKVISISADAESDEKLGEGYQVEVELERDHIIENKAPIKFKPGQTATADIIIRRRRIIDILLDPIKKLQKDGISM